MPLRRGHNKPRLTGEVLVLAPQGVDRLSVLVELSLELVGVGGVGARLFLRRVELRLQVGHLALPLVDQLVELTLSLLVLTDHRLTLDRNGPHTTNVTTTSGPLSPPGPQSVTIRYDSVSLTFTCIAKKLTR